MGMHTDCTYNVNNDKYMASANTQMYNTPTVVYSMGDIRYLHWKRCCIIMGEKGGGMAT